MERPEENNVLTVLIGPEMSLFTSVWSFLGHLDLGKNRIQILYPQKDPCNKNFLVIYNCPKYSFVKIIFYL